MKKNLLTLALCAFSCISSMAFTADDLCGVYLEETQGQQAQSILCAKYDAVQFTNLVIVTKNEDGELQFYGYYKQPYSLKGTFDESTQTITFYEQDVWGSTSSSSYRFRMQEQEASVDASGKISFKEEYKIFLNTDDYCKEMTTTFTKQEEKYTSEGNMTAPGYFDGEATLRSYGSNRYLLTEGSERGYTHYLSVNASTGIITFPWGTVMYKDDPYCYIYDTLEDEDLLMLGNKNEESSFKEENNYVTLKSPFKYYQDYSDEQDPTKKPTAEGTYSATFSISANIQEVVAPATTSKKGIYNLLGQKVDVARNGIFIIDGKKVFMQY